MRVITDAIKWFLYITTGILFVCAINFAIEDGVAIPKNTLWQILLSGFLTSVVTVIFQPEETDGGKVACIKLLLHYVSLCLVMISCGIWFGWMKFNLPGILMMVISVAVVYLFASLFYYIIDIRQADAINKMLKDKYSEEE